MTFFHRTLIDVSVIAAIMAVHPLLFGHPAGVVTLVGAMTMCALVHAWESWHERRRPKITRKKK